VVAVLAVAVAARAVPGGAGASMAADDVHPREGRRHRPSLERGPTVTATAAPAGAGTEFVVVSDVDSHSQCSMRVTVSDGRITAIRGNPDDPECKGALTLRDEHLLELLYAPDRLQYPLKRIGARGEGRWQRITWDEALAIVADRLGAIKRQYGAEAISFHHGHYHSGQLLDAFLSRLANLLGTPNVSNPSHVCLGPRAFLQFQFDLGMIATPDVAHTRCLLLWGGNPEVTNKPQAIAIQEARARGARLIVIDPRVTDYARAADLHAQLRPGTDGALALGLLQVIVEEQLYDREFVAKWTLGFDRLVEHVKGYPPERVEQITWVPANTIREIARLYARTRPACISPRNALDEHTNATCAIRAIDILMAITGNLDIPGGNVFVLPVSLGFEDLKLAEKLPPAAAAKRIGADKVLYTRLSTFYPAAHAPSLWNAMLHGDPYPVKAMLVFAANPLLTHANTGVIEAALRSLDLLVVTDLFMTPTAELADIVLPACTFLEQTRVATYDCHTDHGWNVPSRVVLSPRVVAPLHESRSDWRIIWELGRKLGYAEYFPWQTEEQAIDFVLKPLGLDCARLRAQPAGVIVPLPPILYRKFRGFGGALIRGALRRLVFRHYPAMFRKYEGFMKGFLTPSKKVEIYSERLAQLGQPPLPVHREPAESPVSRPDLARDYPLILIAGSKLEPYTHSMMRNIPSLRREAPADVVEIHPTTAGVLAIRDGEQVRVESPRGQVSAQARLTDSIDPRVVHLSFGFRESNANRLTDHAAFDPVTGSTGLKSLLCRVARQPEPARQIAEAVP
jgi:anaerobic selenocysteine-containing dehydrogenase